MAVKGVIVAAGYGSRLLPITRCVPKEMLPILDRPAIDYVVQEFIDAGIEDLLIITSRRKKSLEDWFDRDPELEGVFRAEGATAKLAKIQPPNIRVQFVRQQAMLGTGQALLLARAFAGQDPVVVAYPDDLFHGQNVSQALIQTHGATGASVLSAMVVEDEEALSRYGVLAVEKGRDEVLRVRSIVEKPPHGTAPSNLVSLGRYLFTPEIFSLLADGLAEHTGGEYFHVDAMLALAAENKLVAEPITATRYDTGTTLDYLKTLMTVALDHPDYGPEMRRFLRDRD